MSVLNCGGCQRLIDKTEYIDSMTCDYCVEHEPGCSCTDCPTHARDCDCVDCESAAIDEREEG